MFKGQSVIEFMGKREEDKDMFEFNGDISWRDQLILVFATNSLAHSFLPVNREPIFRGLEWTFLNVDSSGDNESLINNED